VVAVEASRAMVAARRWTSRCVSQCWGKRRTWSQITTAVVVASLRNPVLRSRRLRALQFVSQRVERTGFQGCAQRCGPRNILGHLLTGHPIEPNE
jgi:hypothetical protein